jgi:hypothetical protein
MRPFLVSLFLLVGGSLFAQKVMPLLHLGVGTSIPVLDYASPSLEKGCFTTAGFGTQLAASTTLIGSWGLMAAGGLYLHPVDVGYLGYEKVKADAFLMDVTIRSEPYRIMSFMGGPMYRKEVLSGFQLQVAAMMGVFSSRTPHQIYKPQYFLVGPEFYEITTSLDRSFAWGAFVSMSYAITPCYFIALETSFLQSNAAFQFYTGSGKIRTDDRTLSMVNIALALQLKLPSWPAKATQ